MIENIAGRYRAKEKLIDKETQRLQVTVNFGDGLRVFNVTELRLYKTLIGSNSIIDQLTVIDEAGEEHGFSGNSLDRVSFFLKAVGIVKDPTSRSFSGVKFEIIETPYNRKKNPIKVMFDGDEVCTVHTTDTWKTYDVMQEVKTREFYKNSYPDFFDNPYTVSINPGVSINFKSRE